jgi:DNA-binding LacI/PurR family transcriptional regulator
MAELGAAGVDRLLHELDGEPRATRVRLHPVELVVRESTGPPNGGG